MTYGIHNNNSSRIVSTENVLLWKKRERDSFCCCCFFLSFFLSSCRAADELELGLRLRGAAAVRLRKAGLEAPRYVGRDEFVVCVASCAYKKQTDEAQVGKSGSFSVSRSVGP